jgi:S-formylglutathione hydrolase
MESYLLQEFLPLLASHCGVSLSHLGISGHSMGGHGALTLALKHPGLFRSVSAFAPIAAPMQCSWGQKAFTAYLGDDRSTWRKHDSCALINEGARAPHLLVDLGTRDEFLDLQLMPDKLSEACVKAGITLDLGFHEGYDHSYFFISTFIDKHLRYHARTLSTD